MTIFSQESIYLEDAGNPTAPFGKGLQIQLASSYGNLLDEHVSVETITIPSLELKYSFNEHWATYGIIKNPLISIYDDGAFEKRINRIENLTMAGVYQPNPELGFWIFREFSFKLLLEVPLQKDIEFDSRFDINWTTHVTDWFEFDFILANVFAVGNEAQGSYSFDLDYYLNYNLLLELGTDGLWKWTYPKDTYETDLYVELSLLSKYQSQFNLRYTRGINYVSNIVEARFIYTLDPARRER